MGWWWEGRSEREDRQAVRRNGGRLVREGRSKIKPCATSVQEASGACFGPLFSKEAKHLHTTRFRHEI